MQNTQEGLCAQGDGRAGGVRDAGPPRARNSHSQRQRTHTTCAVHAHVYITRRLCENIIISDQQYYHPLPMIPRKFIIVDTYTRIASTEYCSTHAYCRICISCARVCIAQASISIPQLCIARTCHGRSSLCQLPDRHFMTNSHDLLQLLQSDWLGFSITSH